LVGAVLALLSCLAAHAQIMSVDLGHEFFKVGLMQQGKPLEIVLNPHSKRKTTSTVSFFESIRKFGDDALPDAGRAPAKVPSFFHHMLGTNFTSASDVKPGGKWWNDFALGDKFYSLNLGYDEERGAPNFHFGEDLIFSGEEVLANIFYFAQTMAKEYGELKTVQDLVVTIPSDANLRQRQAIVAAAEIAGLRVLALVHETSAFAVQRAVDFQPEKGATEYGLMFNLGSRKGEATVVEFGSRAAGMVAGKTAPVVTVLGAATDFTIGGHFMDLKIAETMLKEFQAKFPKLADGVVQNPRALRKLLGQAQKTKAVLSANKKAPFIVESLFEDTDFQTSITRESFEGMCTDMFGKLTGLIDKALEVSNVTMDQLKHIEVVGGAWRVPKVQQLLSEYIESKHGSKLPLGQHLNGEEAAATGSALIGANASSSFRVKKIFFQDTTSHEYSIQVASLTNEWEKNFTKLYPRGSALGGKKKLSFALEEDFLIRLFENGVLVANYEITGLGEILKSKWSEYNTTGQPKVGVSVQLDNSGIVQVTKPLVTVEESFWVNYTKPKKNATNATENGTANATGEGEGKGESEGEGEAEGEGEDKGEAKEDAKAEGEGEADGEDAEDQLIWKLKKKKHEKKLVVNRVDFRPLPVSEASIAESKQRLALMASKEEEVKAVDAIKNELEAMVYGSRDKLESEDTIKVSTEAQREEVTKKCSEVEDWIGEGSTVKADFDTRVKELRDLMDPMQERVTEMEARSDLPDLVPEQLEAVEKMQAHIAKNMSWVSENKTSAAAEKLEEFKTWWAKKEEEQKALPLSDVPAYQVKDVKSMLSKVVKAWDALMKTKKPKEKKVEKPKEKKDDKKAEKEEPMPADKEATEKEIADVQAKKIAAVDSEDFDAADKLKKREKALKEHLEQFASLPADLEATKKELEDLTAEKAAAIENEDYDAAEKLKKRETLLKAHVEKLSSKSEL